MEGEPRRLLLVVGSQCASEPEIPQLSTTTQVLHDLLRDPALGGCAPSLPDGRSLLNGTLTEPLGSNEIAETIKAAYLSAGQAGATLVLALVGHGFASRSGSDLFFMGSDSVQDDPDSAVDVTTLLKYAVNRRGVDGVISILDMCAAGAAPPDQSALTSWSREGGTRLAVIMAAAPNEVAYDLKFSKQLCNVLRLGQPGHGSYLDVVALKPALQAAVTGQTVQAFIHDGISWSLSPDEGLWISRNRAQPDSWNGALDVEWVDYLTARYRYTASRSRVASALDDHQLVVLMGPAASGKSVQLATFANDRFSGSNGAHGAWFCDASNTLQAIAIGLSNQIACRLPDIASATFASVRSVSRARVQADHHTSNLWDVELSDPLLSTLSKHPGTAVTIAIDGLDELPSYTHQQLCSSLAKLLSSASPNLRILLSSRAESFDKSIASRELLSRAHKVTPSPLDKPNFIGWMQDQISDHEIFDCLVEKSSDNWLHSRLLLGLASDGVPCGDLPETLSSAYDLIIRRLKARQDPDGVQERLLRVLAASADMPIPVRTVAGAIQSTGTAITLPELRDLLAALRHVVARLHPGTEREVVRPIHGTFVEWLRSRLGRDALTESHEMLLEGIDSGKVMTRDSPRSAISGVEIPSSDYEVHAKPFHLVGAGRFSPLPEAIESLNTQYRPFLGDQRDEWSKWLQAVSESDKPDQPLARLVIQERIADLTGRAGDAETASVLYQALIDGYEELEASLPQDRIRVARGHAHWTGRSGNPAEASRSYSELEMLLSRIVPSDDPELLGIRGAVAYWTGLSGDESTAVDMLAELLPQMVSAVGDRHSMVLGTRNELANFIGLTGDNTTALRLFVEILEDTEEAFGSNDSRTLTARSQVARWVGKAGRPELAVSLYRSLLIDQERILGSAHLNTLSCRRELGDWLSRAGNRLEALEVYRALITDQEAALPSGHPQKYRTFASVAECIGRLGFPDRAIGLLKVVAAYNSQQFGDSGLAYYRTLQRIAYWDAEAGRAQVAVHDLRKIARLVERSHGSSHRILLSIRRRIRELSSR